MTIQDLYNKPSRYIKPLVKVHLKSGILELGEEDCEEKLIDFIIDNKSSNTSDILLGGIALNRVSVMIDNYNKHFTQNNETSPYKDELIKNVKVEVFIRIQNDSTNKWESTKLGTFYSESWNNKGGKCELVAYDKLWYLSQQPTIFLNLQYSTNAYDFLELYIKNISNTIVYKIDESLKSLVLDYAWLNEGNIATTLKDLAKSLGLYIYINADEEFIVKSALNRNLEAKVTYSDSVNLISIGTYQSINQGFSKVVLDYNLKSENSTSKVILSKSNLQLTNGNNVFEDMTFSEKIVTNVDCVEFTNGKGMTVSDFKYNSTKCDLSVSSASTTTCDLKIYGTTVTLEPISKTFVNQDLLSKIGTLTLTTNTYLLGNNANLTNMGNNILSKVSTFNGTIDLKTIGNVGLELGDVILVNSNVSGIKDVKYDIVNITYKYQGGFSSDIQASINVGGNV